MNWAVVANQLHEHREGLVLLFIAFVVTSPDRVPWPFGDGGNIFQWVWGWGRAGFLTFISLRGPHPPQNVDSAAKVTTVTDPSGKTTEVASEVVHKETPTQPVATKEA